MFHPRLLIASAVASLLSACVVAPYPNRVVYTQPVPVSGYGQPVPAVGYGQQPVVVVDVAPPAAYVEVMPAMPYPGAFWIGGYWGWHGNRHQ